MMLYRGTSSSHSDYLFEERPYNGGIDAHYLLNVIRYRLRLIILFGLAFASLAVAYLAVRAPTYTAATQLLVYNAKLAFNREDAVFPESQLDSTFVETQMEILKAEKIALEVIRRLGLAASEDDKGKAGGGFDLRSLLGLGTTAPDSSDPQHARQQAALKSFQRNLSVERVGLGYVIAVSFTASDPELAARIANETAQVYVEDQDAARLETAQSASAWLRERIRDLGPRTRIVARASRPADKSNPRGLFVLALATLAGLGVGVAAAFGRQLLDRRIHTPEQAAAAAAIECLGVVPMLGTSRSIAKRAYRVPHGKGERHIQDDMPVLAHVLDHPLSPFWHSLRHIHVAMDASGRVGGLRALGVTSTFPGEGKTTIAANLARQIASTGSRVLLVDCNHQDATLSQAFCPGARIGLIDLLESRKPAFAEVLWLDGRSGMHFLPIGGADDRYRRCRVIWSNSMLRLIEHMSQTYEYAIFDLPALAPVADVRAAAEILDRVLLVIDWGQVTAEHLQVGLASAGSLQAKLIGSVLNKVDVSALARMASPTGSFLAHAARPKTSDQPITRPLAHTNPPAEATNKAQRQS